MASRNPSSTRYGLSESEVEYDTVSTPMPHYHSPSTARGAKLHAYANMTLAEREVYEVIQGHVGRTPHIQLLTPAEIGYLDQRC